MRSIRRLGDQIRRLGRSGGGSASPYLLYDLFTSGGVTSPRSCVPGPGSLTITDPDGALSVAGGKLVWNDASLSGATGLIGADAIARQGGLAMAVTLTDRTAIANAVRIGWYASGATVSSVAPLCAMRITASTTAAVARENGDAGQGQNVTLSSSAVAYTVLAVIRDGGGGFVLDREGGSGDWTLRWVHSRMTTASLVPLIHCPHTYSDARFSSDDLAVWVASELATRWGAASYYSATPASGTTGTGSANAFTEVTWTPASSETLNIIFRRTDASNYWTIRCAQSGTVKIIEVTAGAETERASSAQTFTVGSQYKIIAVHDGSVIRVHIIASPASASTVVDKGSYSSATAHQSSTGVAITYGSGTIADFACWPRTMTVALPTP